MINSKDTISKDQGSDDRKDLVREKLERELDQINVCGQALFGLQKFIENLTSKEFSERDDVVKVISETLDGLAFIFRMLNATHNELNQVEDESE